MVRPEFLSPKGPQFWLACKLRLVDLIPSGICFHEETTPKVSKEISVRANYDQIGTVISIVQKYITSLRHVVQRWPAVPTAANKIERAARSMSASSMTIIALFPLNSSKHLPNLSFTVFWTIDPTYSWECRMSLCDEDEDENSNLKKQ